MLRIVKVLYSTGGVLEKEAKPSLAELHPESCSDEWEVIPVANLLL